MLKLLKISHQAQIYSVRQVTERISPLVGTNDGAGGNRCWETLHAADPTTATQLSRSLATAINLGGGKNFLA